MSRRLLVYFSYIGTNYRGLQRVTAKEAHRAPDLDSVQGILEFGLQKILHIDSLPIFVSSRTDTKVHALESTVQFNVKESDVTNGKRPYSPEIICQSLNLFLDKNECDIRVKRIVEVPLNFNCRRAYSRVYEFRVAVLNYEPHNASSVFRYPCSVDIKDLNRCEVISKPFDIDAVQKACNLFLGEWNFSTFMLASRENVPEENRLKTIRRFSLSREIIPDQDSYYSSDELSQVLENPYDVYTFTIEGSGFLRRQVRRMVGSLVGVGKGIIGPNDIIWMLNNPNQQNWPKNVQALGPNGLFLKKIKYSNLDILRGYLS